MIKPAYYVIIVAILFILYLRYIENKSIFFPMRTIELTPDYINLTFEDVYLKTPDNVKINSWFIPSNNAKYTILFCHGNAGNIAHRLDKIMIFHKMGIGVFIIDYRGYGKSEGKPSEKGIYLDSKAAYDYLLTKRNIRPENIILFGESLGAAAAIDLASKAKVGGLITEGAFSNAKDMARRIYPFLPSFVFKSKFDSIAKIKNIAAPKLFIHSKNDEIVPFDLAQKLYDAAGQPKQFVEIIGGHNSAFLDSEEKYGNSIALFIQKLR